MDMQQHDIVQITDNTHPWFPALLIVTEVKSWGVQAYALIIQSNVEQNNGQAFIRLEFEQIEKVGTAVIVNS